ncbi:NF-X1-type zinc finger protein NFXL1-like [Aristolochia californica]|uniref:NF-X1-type zinc finger protein NFXL1-like n=1 Tax=Aristolochia californica TaxID=171875 RepID=UPI0035E12158
MKRTSESSQVPHERNEGPRFANRVARQTRTWVPRGSTAVATQVNTDVSRNGGESSPNASRRRLNSAGQTYVVHSVNKEVAENSGSGESSVPLLVQEIQEKLAIGTVECMICYEMVRRSAAIWSCSSCFSIFHLHCIKKWARAPTSVDLSVERDRGRNWRCPGCQSVQLVASRDIKYTCFCGKRSDPPSDLYLTPHSCGEPCGKSLERDVPGGYPIDDYRCSHMCVLQCHPGPCPPCKVFVPPRSCPCGKNTITRRCSARTSVPSCGLPCNKLLECGRHHCERVCHLGGCDPCQVSVTASCFCKKKKEVILCGEIALKGEAQDSVGLFSCNSICGKTLSCENHDCAETCHPGPCGDCQFLPGKIKTCYCGKTPLETERRSCLDSIPTCSEICSKTLQCGVHLCKEKCHEGDCPPCLVIVAQKCRCGYTSRTVQCYETIEGSYKFVCEKQCGRKKNCGRHRCSERCCPRSNSSGQISGDWDLHLCSILCGKKLRCGQHSCDLLCHSGYCLPCPETIFSDLSCACGKTVFPSPLPCGTPPPFCYHPCSVPQPCGHFATHSCHFGDCPQCSVPVAKECIGGHVVLRNIPCGSKDIRCNQLCGKTRQCGIHACARICHLPPCDCFCASCSGPSGSKVSCGQVCGAPKKDCSHTCTAPCHPLSPCPNLKCDFPVIITCSCGRLTASVPCDAGGTSLGGFHTDTVFEASIIRKLPVPLQPIESNGKKIPLGQRKLVCDEECANLERKLDIAPPNLEALYLGENSSGSELVGDLFRREPKWVIAVEDRFRFMVLGKGKRSTASSLMIHVFAPALKEKGCAIRLIAGIWKLSVHAAGWEPRRFLVVHVTPKSKAPAWIIGSKPGVPLTGLHPSAFDPSIDMDPRLVVALLDLPRDSDISALVLRFGGECELVWLNHRNAMAVFSDPAWAATALRWLDHGSVYHGAAAIPSAASSSNSSWGGVHGKEVAAGVTNVSNLWEKAVVQELSQNEDSSWGQDWPTEKAADAQIGARKGKEAIEPISASSNRWDVLKSDSVLNPVVNSKVGDVSDHLGDGVDRSLLSSSSIIHGGQEEQGEDVEDWEKAYE